MGTEPQQASLFSSRPFVVSAALLLALVLGVIDYLTGPQVAFSIFYFVPIVFVTWQVGRTAGIVLSLVCGGAWFLAEILWHQTYIHPLIPYWNALMRTAVFFIITFLSSYVKTLTRDLETKVIARTADLEADIARRVILEQALQESEQKYKDLVENSMVGIFKTTLSGKILYVNRALLSMLEFDSPDELLAQNVIVRYKNPEKRQVLLDQLRRDGKVASIELEILTKTNKTKNVLLSATLNGETISGMIRDITSMRLLEQQLLQVQKLESLGTLAGGIAHDFNNILGIILGHALMIERTQYNPDRVRRGLQSIISASQRGAGLVRQLLTFARKTDVLLGPVHVNHIVTEVTKLLSETFPKTIVISAELGTGLPVITADLNQLHQVLINLCLNARDSMPEGGTLSIRTKRIAGSTIVERFSGITAPEYVLIEVSDTGAGMDEETKRRVFEPFFTTKERGKGTGLGLAVVFGIMESHGGFIDVESEISSGTTFSLYFPVKANGLEMLEITKEIPEDVHAGAETILLVEDEEELRNLAEVVLTKKGYVVLTARDGEEAIETYRHRHREIALVVSDLGLPKLSGEDVLRRLKEFNPDVRLLLVSGFVEPEQKAEILKAGAIEVLPKPYSPNELLKKVRDALDA
jgi:PAS domain S-box-containing protein